MSALIDTLTTAPAGSRELDADVAEAAGWKKGIHHGSSQYQRQDGRWFFNVPAFTTSLDATFAEAQRREWHIVAGNGHYEKDTSVAVVWLSPSKPPYHGEGQTPALAACAALIAAVEAG